MIKKILRKLPFRIASWTFDDGIAIGTYNLKEPEGHLAETLLTVEKRTNDDAAVIRIDQEQAQKLGIKIEMYDFNLGLQVQRKLYVLAGYREDDNGSDTDEPELCKTQAEAVEAMADSVIDFICDHVDVTDDTVCMEDFQEVGIFDQSNLDDEFKSKIKDGKVAIADIRSYIIRKFDVSAYVETSSCDRECIDLRIYEKSF